jgi:indolepyruvate ferredoxin oxidoreductase
VTPTPAFQRNPDLQIDQIRLVQRLRDAVGADRLLGIDATGLGLALLGDSIAANLFMLGFASQSGLLPVSPHAIRRAVEINAVAVPFNLRAFDLGRLQVVDPARVERALTSNRPEPEFRPLTELADIVAHRIDLLTHYQDAKYAQRYRQLVEEVAAAEQRVAPGKSDLAVAVARTFAKLMAYKDEYEVARLHSDPKFREQLQSSFEPGMKLRYNLAPPLIAKRDPQTGHLVKREFGAWVGSLFRVMAPLKILRGTPLDLFGHTAERRMERQLITHYEQQMRELSTKLDTANYAVAVELATLAAQIRGYGHIKEANVAKVRALEPALLAKFHNPRANEIAVPVPSVAAARRRAG